ncbi:hypothetical protein [Rubrivirga sp. IMCC45206]|uniref:hypothetical protein n=1 Tax=Rubrivirga sp. IMCC45206 TaxID=3391614 RepID=UPI00398FCCA5
MRTAFPLLLALALVAGCSDAGPTASDPTDARPVLDVSGTWDWSEVTHIRATPFAAGAIFGVTPEGPVTHLSCPSAGTLTVAQTGETFSGTSTQAPAVCTTRGGQTAPAPFPLALDITGEVRGRSLRFTFETGGFPCHYRGSLRATGGTPTAWRATGGCEVPPEFGKDKILDFVATRP